MGDVLDLIILKSGKRNAIVFARYGCDTAIERLPLGKEFNTLNAFKERINEALLLNQKRPSANELNTFGQRLFRYVIRNGIKQLYDRLPLDILTRVHILTDQPELQSLPWEYWQDPNQIPGGPWLNRSIVRVIPTIGRAAPVPFNLGAKSKLRILFVYAVPQDQTLVSWPPLKTQIETSLTLSAGIPADRFELNVIQGTGEALFQAIQSETEKYDIFQFSGHGDVDPMTKEGRILLVDSKKSDQSHPVTANRLAMILQGRGVRLAVLSACLTAAGNAADPFSIVAEALLRAGIPAVVANQLPVPDESVATFVGALYAQLLTTGDIDMAVNSGRVKLAFDLAKPQDATLEWGIPTLYRYIDAQRVFR